MASADLRAELSCSVCLSIFTDPVTLRCGHNFCQLCIGQVLDTQAESGVYSCPDCREGFHKRPSLHRNLALRNIAERVSSAQCDRQDSGIFCSYCIHSPVPAAKSCLLCEASLCHDHLRVHSKSEEHVLSDPTAAPGNRKCAAHKKPLMYYCKKDGECVCLSCCLNGEHMGHRVDLMTEASEKKKKKLCAIMEELRKSKDQTDTRVTSLHERKKQMPKKVEALQRAANDLSKDLKRQQDVLKKTVLNEIARQEKQNASSIDHLIQQLEIKKVELSRKLHHIEELCNVTDPVTILQNPDTEDFGDPEAENKVLPEDVDVEKDGENVANLADAEGDLDEGMISVMLHKGLSDIMTSARQDFRTMWESDISLDVRTASNNVHISGDQKTASWSQKSQGRQETPERFQSFKVLSSTRFSSGRHFWEVEANKIGNWRLGVAYASIDRKGDRSNIGNNDKSWGLRWCSNQLSARYDCKEISLSPKLQSNSVGIYLDYEGGQLSFYDMCNPLRHLHTYKASFTEPLHVVFALWNNAWLKVPVPPNIGSLAAVTGVLLSTENSRSFSAPVLTSERRLAISSLNSFTPLHKPERSISPESNDSISEELNHFKPIVCSPCTPPKRLPDGRVLSPVIIKSTPRNLRRNLQKPTSYEASPMILKKWEQVFQDRQMKRTLSKGTLTTCVEDDGPSVKKQETASKGRVACQITFSDVEPAGDVELPPSCSREDASQANRDSKEQSMPCGDCIWSTGPNAEPVIFQGFTEATANSQVGTKTRLATRLTSSKKTISACKCLVAKPMKASLKRVHKKTSQSIGMQNGSCFSTTEAISLAFPPRRGLKRRCKTKHLEQNGGLKRLRVAGQGGFERIWRGAEKKLHQEEEDKKLAVKLQQIFDKESRRVNRKSSRDEYHLRSKSTASAN